MPVWVMAENIAERLKDLRVVVLGRETQRIFGERFGRAWKQAGIWERGESRPSPSTIELAARKNGWPLSIFSEGGPMPSELLGKGKETGLVRESVARYGDAEGDEPEGPGWLWQDPTEAEESFRTYIRNVERSVRGMVIEPAAVEKHLKDLRLVVVDMFRSGARAAGKPIPPFVQVVENEIIAGTFR